MTSFLTQEIPFLMRSSPGNDVALIKPVYDTVELTRRGLIREENALFLESVIIGWLFTRLSATQW